MPESSQTIRLGEVAQIFRCMVPKKNISPEEMARYEWQPGKLPDGSCIALEISMDHIDSATCFVSERAPLVSLNLTPRQEKYLLRQNDILISYIAARKKLGFVGFVPLQMSKMAISGRSVAVVRANKIDPVWLFFRLCEQDFRDTVQIGEKDGVACSIPMALLKGFSFDMPKQAEIDGVRESMKNILKNDAISKKALKAIYDERYSVRTMFALQKDLEFAKMMSQKKVILTGPEDGEEER